MAEVLDGMNDDALEIGKLLFSGYLYIIETNESRNSDTHNHAESNPLS